jgi:hypothetical protein
MDGLALSTKMAKKKSTSCMFPYLLSKPETAIFLLKICSQIINIHIAANVPQKGLSTLKI